MNEPTSAVSAKQYAVLLGKYLRPQWGRVLLLAVLLFTNIGVQLYNPQVLRNFIDTATTGGSMDALVRLALVFLGLAIFAQLLSVVATYVSENIGWTATNMLRLDVALHCLQLDMTFHKARTPGEMIERVDGDVNALSRFFSQFVIQVVGNIFLMIGVLVLLFREDWRVGLALAALAAFSVWLMGRVRNIAVPALTAQRQSTAELFGFVEERLSGLPDIRANGAGAHVMRGFYHAMSLVYHTGRQGWRMEALLWIITVGLYMLAYVLVFILGTWLFGLGALTIGTMYLLYQYTELLRAPLDQLTDQLQDLQKAGAGIKRVTELFTLQPDLKEGPGVQFPAGPISVEFDQVSFGYGDEDMVLHDLSFQLEPGEVLGLLGRTGSGKTTVTRLLFRLYDPASGTLRLGGKDIRLARFADLRRHIGMVTQDVQLFGATLRENLTMFDTSVPDERILDVLGDVGLLDWYNMLPAGLDTDLGDGGVGLSAGEAQLLAFSRVFLKDPGLVILDEASSRLDPATEQLIERAVDKLLLGRTAIIIAHRLATVERADRVLILENGRIIEEGERAALVEDPASRFSHLLRAGMEEVLV